MSLGSWLRLKYFNCFRMFFCVLLIGVCVMSVGVNAVVGVNCLASCVSC